MLNKMIMIETTASDIKQENNLKCIFYKRFEYSEVFVIIFCLRILKIQNFR